MEPSWHKNALLEEIRMEMIEIKTIKPRLDYSKNLPRFPYLKH